MRPHAQTAIWCPTEDPDKHWHVLGLCRPYAEAYYRNAIDSGAFERPMYRIIVQYLVDQHDEWLPTHIH